MVILLLTISCRKCLVLQNTVIYIDIPVGLLDFELSVLPLKYPKSNQVPIFVEEGAVAQHLQKERLRDLSIDARFRAYAKAWWQDYASIRPQHQDRLIKLFAAGCRVRFVRKLSCFPLCFDRSFFLQRKTEENILSQHLSNLCEETGVLPLSVECIL